MPINPHLLEGTRDVDNIIIDCISTGIRKDVSWRLNIEQAEVVDELIGDRVVRILYPDP